MKATRIGLALAPAGWLLHAACWLGAPNGAQAQQSGVYTHYAVAADHSDGAAAGAAMLTLGGNAADALASALLALGVVHPASSGLGGGGYALYYDAKSQEVTALDFREEAPAATTPTMFINAAESTQVGPLRSASQVGGLAVAIPGEAAGIYALMERFGRLDRGLVTQPAIHLAEEGFAVSPHLAALSANFSEQLREDAMMRSWLLEGAEALIPGQVLKRPALAETLRRFAAQGDRAIYRGPVAKDLVARVRQGGGHLSLKDLRDYSVRVLPPLQDAHFGYRWVTAPPASAGGIILLQSLGLLERWLPEGAFGRRDAVLHAFVEAFKGSFWDRERFIGDPMHITVPLDQLLSPQRTGVRAASFHPFLAMRTKDYEVPVFGYADPLAKLPDGAGTANVCVIDGEGNAAVATTTINLPFGARIATAGIVLNDEMDDFALPLGPVNPSHASKVIDNLPRPGHRPLSTLAPTLVFDAKGLALCIGASSGGTRIVTAVAQVAFDTLVAKTKPDIAVSRARIHHQGRDAAVRTELFRPLDASTERGLKARGHRLQPINFAAAVQLIQVIRSEGQQALVAVTDPRKPSTPAGR